MNYFILVNKEQRGPFTIVDLKEMGITSETLVWHDGMPQWTPAWQIEELRPVLSDNARATDIPTPAAQQPQQQQPPQSQQQPQQDGDAERSYSRPTRDKSSKTNRGCLIAFFASLVAFVVIVFAMIATCPNAEDHEQAVQGLVTKVVNNTVEKQMGEDPFAAFGQVLATSIVKAAVSQMLTVDDYAVCSIGVLHFDGNAKAVSLGILGHVYTFDEKEIERSMENASGLKLINEEQTNGEEEENPVSPHGASSNYNDTEDHSSSEENDSEWGGL